MEDKQQTIDELIADFRTTTKLIEQLKEAQSQQYTLVMCQIRAHENVAAQLRAEINKRIIDVINPEVTKKPSKSSHEDWKDQLAVRTYLGNGQ